METGQVVIYLDDILIFATTLAELICLTHLILQQLEKLDLYLQLAKCSFNQTSVEYLGLIISEGELCIDLVKLCAIQQWPIPKKVKDVQKFLGFCNFYWHFIQNYSLLARPLFNLTKKDIPFVWTKTQDNTFKSLQNMLCGALVLVLPDYGKPFTLTTDASNFATGAILEQEDALGRSRPVAYFSKSFQPAEHNYKIYDKELLAIVHALKHFCHYLQGNKHRTQIFSDHANLRYFTTKQTLICCQARWSLFLAEYDYVIIPKPGPTNKADALSRCPDYKEGIASENNEQVLLTLDKFQIHALHTTAIPMGINKEIKATIHKAIQEDKLTGKLLKDILVSGPRHITKGLQDWNHEDGLILYKGLVYVPKNKELQ